MRISRSLAMTAAVACGILAAAIPGLALPADGPTATSQPALDPWLQDLQKRLNSADATERDAAQKELASIAALWQQPDLLQRLADATSDPELRGLFRQRADLLRGRVAEKDAMNLPPISLTLHNAGFSELADGLNAALDTDMFRFNNNGNGAGAFNIDIQKQPFWEVFRLLQDQQPFSVQNNGNGIMLYNNSLGVHNFAVSGPAMLYPLNTTYRRTANLQTTDPPTIGVSLTLGMIVDPRVPVSRFTNFTITKAGDEAGHDLLRPGQSSSNGNAQSNMTNMGFSLAAVEGMGKRLALSCDAKIAIQTSFIEATQDDIQNNLNKDFTLGNRTVRVAAFRLTQNNLFVQTTAGQRGPFASPEEANAVIQYRVTDSNGKTIWTSSSQGGFGNNVLVPAGTTGPFRMRMRMTSKTQDLVLHFDLKDIPLP